MFRLLPVNVANDGTDGDGSGNTQIKSATTLRASSLAVSADVALGGRAAQIKEH
jgi:hypothetical protein